MDEAEAEKILLEMHKDNMIDIVTLYTQACSVKNTEYAKVTHRRTCSRRQRSFCRPPRYFSIDVKLICETLRGN